MLTKYVNATLVLAALLGLVGPAVAGPHAGVRRHRIAVDQSIEQWRTQAHRAIGAGHPLAHQAVNVHANHAHAVNARVTAVAHRRVERHRRHVTAAAAAAAAAQESATADASTADATTTDTTTTDATTGGTEDADVGTEAASATAGL
jgi:hypothetical protein